MFCENFVCHGAFSETQNIYDFVVSSFGKRTQLMTFRFVLSVSLFLL